MSQDLGGAKAADFIAEGIEEPAFNDQAQSVDSDGCCLFVAGSQHQQHNEVGTHAQAHSPWVKQ